MAAKFHIFADSFEELVNSCVFSYERNKNQMSLERVREKRAKLSGFAEIFHKDCGTLTPSVQKKIEDLKRGIGLVLMTAHQPNFFAYSGVLRKATLNFALATRLEKLLGVPVVSFFGIADQDFTDDRWVRSCQLPAVQRCEGVLTIGLNLPEKLMLNRVGKPSADCLNKWKADIDQWLNEAAKSVERLSSSLSLPETHSSRSISIMDGNLLSFWNVVNDCYNCSDKYSDFNAFMISKIVNDVWGYDTVFSRFSECQQSFADEFGFLLSHFDDYSRLLREAKEMPHDEHTRGGVSDQEPLLAPFWYHCDCGSKAKLFVDEKNKSLFGRGNCVGCGEYYELEFGVKSDPDISSIASRISARAIPMSLVFFRGLMPSCYIGGVGGTRYLTEAQHVAEGLGITFPSSAVWRPLDRYYGVGQIEAVFELERICRSVGAQNFSIARELLEARIRQARERLDKLEALKKEMVVRMKDHPEDEMLREQIKKTSMNQSEIKKSSNLSVIIHESKILENVAAALNLIPSVIDYAVNIGLKGTSEQWIQYLNENGDLSSSVQLKSILDQTVRLNLDLLAQDDRTDLPSVS